MTHTLDDLIEKYANLKVLKERNRCLKILDGSNANDAHRYYIQNPNPAIPQSAWNKATTSHIYLLRH